MNIFRRNIWHTLAGCLLIPFAALFAACSSSKFLNEEELLLDKVAIISDKSSFRPATLSPYIRQRANSRWFSLFKIPLGTYSLAGRDTTKWLNRTLQRIGEHPVVYDSVQARLTQEDLLAALHNMGYMDARVHTDTKVNKHKVALTYVLSPGERYRIGTVRYVVDDARIDSIFHFSQAEMQGLKPGMDFSVQRLDEERKRIAGLLLNNGFYKFNKDFMGYEADSVVKDKRVNLVFRLFPFQENANAPETQHPRYTLRKVEFDSPDQFKVPLRTKVLGNNTALQPGQPFSAADLQRTYNNFARLQAVRYTNIKFSENPDTTLDAHIQLSMNKVQTLSFQPEGTNTAGDLGAAASLTYTNRNLFHGSELFSVELRGAFEAIKGLEGYQNRNYEEYGVEAKLVFPRLLIPLLSRRLRNNSSAVSELSTSWNLQNRPEFHRRVFSTAWRYRWNNASRNESYRVDVLDLNYVYMPWLSSTFKSDYLDDETNRNAILRYNYEDLFIMKAGFGFSKNTRSYALRANVETAGNVLNILANTLKFSKNSQGQYTLFNIAFAQYAKFDVDFTRMLQFDERNELALHAAFGVAVPMGNSSVLPFEKRYFSGGANSVRGWSVRGLGPGSFAGTDGRIDFINQTGDMKLDLNAEYRTFLFWKVYGAAFVDAGNIWTLRSYPEQPGGQFKFDSFYKQIAVAYGLGLRFNFDYFVLRLDAGMKAVNPAYPSGKEHWPLLAPRLGRDLALHFSVGLPF